MFKPKLMFEKLLKATNSSMSPTMKINKITENIFPNEYSRIR